MIESILTALHNFAVWVFNTTGYLGIVITMALESACIPIPSEVVMPLGGAHAATGGFNFWLVVAAGTLGNLIGSIAAWWVGLKGGRPLIERYGRYILLSDHSLRTAERWFARHGEVTVFFSRMMPIIRTFISLPAGIGKMRLSRFCIYTVLGAIPWNWLLTWVGFEVGLNWEEKYGKYFHSFQKLIAVVIIIGFVWFVWHHVRGRIRPKPKGESPGKSGQ
jgi:membrane protein DedA with SNARE-associated domain